MFIVPVITEGVLSFSTRLLDHKHHRDRIDRALTEHLRGGLLYAKKTATGTTFPPTPAPTRLLLENLNGVSILRSISSESRYNS